MLTKDAKSILKFANAGSGKLSYTDIQNHLSCDFDKAKSICDHLINEGYATERMHHPLPGSEISWGISLTEKGRNRKKFFLANWGLFILKNFAIPIIVSIITAAITTLITTAFLE